MFLIVGKMAMCGGKMYILTIVMKGDITEL